VGQNIRYRDRKYKYGIDRVPIAKCTKDQSPDSYKELSANRRLLVPASSAPIATAFVAPTSAVTTRATATTAFLGAGLIDRYGPAVHLLTVEGGDGRLRFLVTAHLNKAEPFGLPSGAIRDHLGGTYSTMNREQPFQITAADQGKRVI
jgi:hypothetical protein